ncbi:MAG: hypothetical protein MHMPM18_000839 [Marteilia pararefringens]
MNSAGLYCPLAAYLFLISMSEAILWDNISDYMLNLQRSYVMYTHITLLVSLVILFMIRIIPRCKEKNEKRKHDLPINTLLFINLLLLADAITSMYYLEKAGGALPITLLELNIFFYCKLGVFWSYLFAHLSSIAVVCKSTGNGAYSSTFIFNLMIGIMAILSFCLPLKAIKGG